MNSLGTFTAEFRRRTIRFGCICALVGSVTVAKDAPRMSRVTIRTGDVVSELTGRVVVRAQDGGILLEERNGRLKTLPATSVDRVTELTDEFQQLSSDELATELLNELGASFNIHITPHFVICSDASERYTDYCGRLLEHVHAGFLKFMEGSEVKLREPPSGLPVVIFGRNAAFQDFAANQHPGTDFSDVPGYYSVRDNQMLISGLSGDRTFRTNSDVLRELKKKPRQVETIVHEAVHQLAFNTGLQVRFADNPMWLSEGLAVYFEQASGRGRLLWSRPGSTSRIHLPGFKVAAAGGRLRLPLSELLSSDAAFSSSEQLADAYAEGWALAFYLIRTDRKAFDRLLSGVGQNKPLRTVTAEARLRQMTEATGKSIPELETAVIRYVGRLR